MTMTNQLHEEWCRAASLNPYLRARLAAGLTQEELAQQSGVTVQYIRRQEQGLVNTPSATIDRILEVDPADYYSWVHKMRTLVEPGFANFGWNPGNGHMHPFYYFMGAVTVAVDRHFDVTVGTSQQMFSRYLCMHPRNWQLYVVPGHDARLPPMLKSILLQSEHLKRHVAKIEAEVAGWLMK